MRHSTPAAATRLMRGLSTAATVAPLLLLIAALSSADAQATAADAAVKDLYIVHINDVHNRIEQTAPSASVCVEEQAAENICVGGWARISTAVNAARKRAADQKAGFLFLDAGDEFDGSLWDVVAPGYATSVMQNIVKPDAMTLGNHEFSFPAATLKAYISNLTFPVLGACNINTSKEPSLTPLLKKFTVKQIGKYKVAIVGWITPDTSFTAANAGNFGFDPVVPSVRKCIAELKKEHPDVHMIIGLSHTGYHEDLATAKAIPDLDLIVGGHSHTFLNSPETSGPIFDKTLGATAANCVDKRACDEPSGPFPTTVAAQICAAPTSCKEKPVQVVQAYYASKYLGQIKINLETKKLISADPLLLGGLNSSSPVAMDPQIVAAIKKMEGPVRALETRKSGVTKVLLVGGKVGRTQETNFGDYLASLLMKTAQKLPNFAKSKGDVNIGLINAGAIRADIEPESVSYGEVLTALPFLNTLAIKPLTGKQIKEIMAFSVAGVPEQEGRFLQVAGLRVWHRGPKLLEVKLLHPNGTTTPLDPKQSHNIATLDFLCNGGDGYTAFKTAPSLMAGGNRIDELMFNDFAMAAPKPIDVPDPAKERRIIDCAASYVDCVRYPELYGPCGCPAAGGGGATATAAELRAKKLLRRLLAWW